jgi:SAM-dependent methyltransferase
MAHPQQRAFFERVKKQHREFFSWWHRVLDCGSLDINGNNKSLFPTTYFYLGVDVVGGPNVDMVERISTLTFRDNFFGVVISSEMLEHDIEWEQSLRNMFRMLRSGGLLTFTCATYGRPEHGTARTTPQDAPGLPWPDYYRNLGEQDIRQALDMSKFKEFAFQIEHETHDLYFWGIKA